jgi:hypothetical protein
VFSEQRDIKLPKHQPWDFEIELEEGAELPKPAGIYPMSDAEKKDL